MDFFKALQQRNQTLQHYNTTSTISAQRACLSEKLRRKCLEPKNFQNSKVEELQRVYEKKSTGVASVTHKALNSDTMVRFKPGCSNVTEPLPDSGTFLAPATPELKRFTRCHSVRPKLAQAHFASRQPSMTKQTRMRLQPSRARDTQSQCSATPSSSQQPCQSANPGPNGSENVTVISVGASPTDTAQFRQQFARGRAETPLHDSVSMRSDFERNRDDDCESIHSVDVGEGRSSLRLPIGTHIARHMSTSSKHGHDPANGKDGPQQQKVLRHRSPVERQSVFDVFGTDSRASCGTNDSACVDPQSSMSTLGTNSKENQSPRSSNDDEVDSGRYSSQGSDSCRSHCASCPDLADSLSSTLTLASNVGMPDNNVTNASTLRQLSAKTSQRCPRSSRLEYWNMSQIMHWLEAIGAEKLASLLVGYELKGEDLKSWNLEKLREYGLDDKTECARVLGQLRKLSDRQDEHSRRKTKVKRCGSSAMVQPSSAQHNKIPLFSILQADSFDRIVAFETALTIRDISVAENHGVGLRVTRARPDCKLLVGDCIVEINGSSTRKLAAVNFNQLVMRQAGRPLKLVVLRCNLQSDTLPTCDDGTRSELGAGSGAGVGAGAKFERCHSAATGCVSDDGFSAIV